MYCLRCGTKVEDNVAICPHCGANIKEELSRYNYPTNDNDKPKRNLKPTHEDQYNYSLKYSYATNDQQLKQALTNPITKNMSPTEEEYIKAYIGPKYDNFLKNKISWSSFFFGPIYFCYRKYYSLAIIYILASIITMIISPILWFFLVIFISSFFNELYIKHAQKKVREILVKYKDLDHETKLKKCKQAGGTNVLILVLLIILIGIIIPITIVTSIEEYDSTFNSSPLTADETYTLNDLTYTIPKGYKLEYENIDEEYGSSKNYYNENFCSIDIEEDKEGIYTSAEDYLTSTTSATLNDKISPITKININNNEWSQISVEEEYYMINKYVIQKGDDLYILRTSGDKDENCEADFQTFLNSITLQN